MQKIPRHKVGFISHLRDFDSLSFTAQICWCVTAFFSVIILICIAILLVVFFVREQTPYGIISLVITLTVALIFTPLCPIYISWSDWRDLQKDTEIEKRTE